MKKKNDKSKSVERTTAQNQESTDEELELEIELGRQIMRKHRGTLEALAKEGHGEKEPA